jgi:4-amino-4-deoxy-L-arabinose transferase-like glycosyltransferase
MHAASAAPALDACLPPAECRRLRAHTLVLLLPVLAGLFIGLAHPIQDLNEGLYARIPQEMLASGHWIVPTLDGVPYLEKPPLMYWVTAVAFGMFGANEWSARAAPVLGMILAIAAISRFARRELGDDAAALAVAMFATTPLAIVLGRTLIFDALYTGLTAWSLALLSEFLASGERRALRRSYACLALAILTKGLAAGAIYAAVALVHAFPSGRIGARLRALLDPLALAIFLAIAAPWHIVAAIEEPGFAWFYFVNEHVLRFLGTRVPHDYHVAPWWYYLPRVVAYTFPWSVLALIACRVPHAGSRTAVRFLWAWLLVPLAIFSAAGEKGEYYLFIATPALALLLARHAVALGGRRVLAWLPAALLALLAAARWIWHDYAPYRLPPHAHALLLAGAALACASLVLLLRRRLVPGILALAATGCCAAALLSAFLSANADLKSAHGIARVLEQRREAPVYVYRDFETASSLPYYLAAPVRIVDARSSDLWYGITLHPDARRFPTLADFERIALREPVWLVVQRRRWRTFAASPLSPLFAVRERIGSYVLLQSIPDAAAARSSH